MTETPREDKRFSYAGPARIGGLQVEDVRLWEERDLSETGRTLLRDWKGSATWMAPEGDDPNKPIIACGQVLIELTANSEVLTGQALVSVVTFDGTFWSLEIAGLGPPPGFEE